MIGWLKKIFHRHTWTTVKYSKPQPGTLTDTMGGRTDTTCVYKVEECRDCPKSDDGVTRRYTAIVGSMTFDRDCHYTEAYVASEDWVYVDEGE